MCFFQGVQQLDVSPKGYGQSNAFNEPVPVQVNYFTVPNITEAKDT